MIRPRVASANQPVIAFTFGDHPVACRKPFAVQSTSSAQNDVDIPNATEHSAVPSMPTPSTRRGPSRSAAHPQKICPIAYAALYAESMFPS